MFLRRGIVKGTASPGLALLLWASAGCGALSAADDEKPIPHEKITLSHAGEAMVRPKR